MSESSNPERIIPAMSAIAREAATVLEHARIRKTRAVLFNDINVGVDDAQRLKRLAALDRYERIAHAKRRKAAKIL